MKLENQFSVPSPPDETWRILLDVPRIVSCVPGAELLSGEPGGTYKGRISVKLGPVALKFMGTVTFAEINEESHTAIVNAKGSDQQGRGNAGAVTTMRIAPSEGGATVFLETEMQLSGLVAQYGRASGVIVAVSNEMIAHFAAALREQLTALNTPTSDGVSGPDSGVTADARIMPPVQSIGLFTILCRALLAKLGLRRAAH